MTFEEFLEEKNLTPENTPGSEHALMKEAYEAGFKELLKGYNEHVDKYNSMVEKYNEQTQTLKQEFDKNRILSFENKQLKKNAIVWHRTDFDNLKDGKIYLLLFKNHDICSAPFWRGDSGCFFEAYDWNEIAAWAELPEVKL